MFFAQAPFLVLMNISNVCVSWEGRHPITGHPSGVVVSAALAGGSEY